jgi:rubrerythrin
MRNPWQWLLDYTGVTAEIKRLEKKVYHTEDTVRQRDGQISELHKVYSDTLDARNVWEEIAEKSQRREQYYKGVYKKIADGQKHCRSREHEPPMHIVLDAGATYEWTCPACGTATIVRVRERPVFLCDREYPNFWHEYRNRA